MIKTAILLAGCALMGCAHSTHTTHSISHTSNLVEAQGKALPVRVILNFKTLIADNKALSDVISEACQCSVEFIRNYTDHALIYEIALPTDQPFAAFEKRLLEQGSSWQIESVERDARMKHQ